MNLEGDLVSDGVAKVTGLPIPTADSDAATKLYVDESGGSFFSSPSDTVVFTSSGTFNKTAYPNLIGVRVRGVGGGGGGGGAGATAAGQWSSGAGGGGAGYFEKWIPVTDLLASETVTVGGGGAGGVGGGGNSGGTGGNTSFGAHATANGGTGGSSGSGTSGNGGVGGAAGGTATGGDLNVSGGAGDARYASGTGGFASGGKGGNSLFGEGGSHKVVGGSGGGDGEPAQGYGSGGGGAGIAPSQTAKVGGAATGGVLVVDVYESVAVANAAIVNEVVTFTASGTFDKANYPGLVAVRVRLVGGGGGGGGVGTTAAGQAAAGGGGSGGGYCEKLYLAADLDASESVVVGAGGSGGAAGANNGGSGEASTFKGLTAAGGGGGNGQSGLDASTARAGAVGGSAAAATGGDVNVQGTPDRAATLSAAAMQGAFGGSSVLSPGREQGSATSGANGVGGRGAGGGGGGGWNTASQGTNRFGGDGTQGVCIIEVYRAVVTNDAAGTTEWYPLSGLYQNGFDDYNTINASGVFTNGRYRKVGDQVYVEGMVDGGDSSGNLTIATLPVGFRPTHTHIFSCWVNTVSKRIQVEADGDITIIGYTAEEWVSLEGIRFSVLP